MQAAGDAVEALELLVEMNDLGGIDRHERGMELRAMQRNVGRAKALLDRGPHGVQIRDLATIPLAIVSDLGRKACATNALLQPQAAQDLHRIRVHLDAGADARECLRLLIDLRIEPDLSQRGGSGQPCDAGADDGYCGQSLRHRALRSDLSSPNNCARLAGHASSGLPIFSRSARNTVSGVSGNSIRRTPTASSMALAIAGDRQSVADSPAPLAPNGPLC
jgi:hypothetical protein